MMARNKPILPPTYLLLSMVMMVLLHYVFPVMTLVPKPWILLGLIPIILGISINLHADRLFKNAQTTLNPFGDSSELVTEGIYSYSRNPMYLGMVLILLGVAITLGSLTPFVMIIIFSILITNIFISHEERKMESKFGRQWIEYTLRVRRWI